MDPLQPIFFDNHTEAGSPGRLAHTESCTKYGSLGPIADVALAGPDMSAPVPTRRTHSFRPAIAVALGVILAVLFGNVGSAHASWKNLAGIFVSAAASSPLPPAVTDPRALDRMAPQQQAETLLELAVGNSDGALEQISLRLGGWRGKITWTSQFATLAASALNSNDLRVREAGIEIELAAYGLDKNSFSVDSVAKDADSPDHARKVWALWALGLLANRGVDAPHITQILTAHLNDTDEDSRRWAIEGLALVGAPSTIPVLLRTMHDDPSAAVRERAACSLAESGMLTHEQRLMAVPQLLVYTDDPALDAKTHTWAFQALSDITHQHLPNDSATWRAWYASYMSN